VTSKQLKLWGAETMRCPTCGERIIVSERRDDGTIYSEYVGEGGRCYQCSFRRKKNSGDRAT